MNFFWKTFLIALLVLFLCTVAPASAADTITVPDDYPTIQQAIDNATADDTIVVSAGTYNEHILVDKRLTISGTEIPVIDGELKFGVNTVTLTASGINFTGITIIGGGSNAAGVAVTADNVEVRDCYVHDNKGYGIELSSVSDVVIRDNNISNNFGPGSTGIRLDASNGNFVYNNILRNNNVFGLELEASSSNVIEKNTVQTSGSYGVSIETGSNLNRFLENVVEETESEHGIKIYNSDSNLFQENTIRNNGDDNSGHVGIFANTIHNTTFEYNIFIGNKGTGMDLTDCYDSVFANNTILRNNEYGINCYDCDDNTFTNNTISNNAALYAEPGLFLYSSGGNTVVNNTIKDNGNDGIYLEYSHSNTLFGNVIEDNSNRGLFLKNSRYNELYENNITGNLYNFGITIGGTINYFGNTVGESNLVDGKPIVYLIGAENSVVNESSNAATVYCIDCDNITVENLTLTNNSYGIVFYNTINSNIQENHVSSCEDGIFLMDSDGNVVKSNNASYNSQYGISERSSTGNFIYLNNFIGNEDADYYSDSSVTTWRSPVELLYFFGGNQYNGYLGNYWGSYTGSDGNGDGIGDTAFTISGETNNDDYPLIKTKEFFTFTPNQPPSADFMYSPLSPDTDDTIVFSDASIDLDGTIGSWAWDFGDGGTSALQNPTHQYALPGFYQVNLTVTDNNLDTGNTAKSLFVHAAGSMTIYVPENFSTIQTAINAARDGDAVLVRSGTYPENVLVNKSVAVTGEGLPVVDAAGGTGFTVESPACAIDSFAIIGSTEWESGGIKVESDGNTIKNNVLSGNFYGIYLTGAENNILFNNSCNDSAEHGIYLSSSMNNTIYNNTCANNSALGGGEGGHGYGICLSSSGGNVLYFNDLDNGDLLTPGLFYNAFDSNTTTSLNTWYNTTLQLGNHYSDYYGTDGNGDGVGDQPYEIDHSGGDETLPNFDLYPLMPLGPRPEYAPIVGGVQAADLTAASINISWDIENEIPCDNRILYGTAPSLSGALWSGWDNATTEPGIKLSGLLSNTTYYYSCYSYNSENSSLFDNSSMRSFTTLLRPNMIITVDDDNSDIPTPPADYASLSAALQASLDGDTILVYSGNYTGNHIVDKSLNITGIGRPVLTGEEYEPREDIGDVVSLEADGCILQGFKITEGYWKNQTISRITDSACIRIGSVRYNTGYGADWFYYGADNNIIRDNIIDAGRFGLYVNQGSRENEFSNNRINGTYEGIFCNYATDNTFADNELTGVEHYGIRVARLDSMSYYPATRNVIRNNTLTDLGYSWGIELDGVSDNIIRNNTLRENNLINVIGDRNILENNRVEGPHEYHKAGIHITSGEDNALLNNTVSFQKFGILLTPRAETVTMRNNTMEDNTYNFGFTGDWAFAPTSPPGHIIDTSNTVDEKPIYYFIGEQNRELSYSTLIPAPGYLACIDCTNITIKDFYLENNCQGIFLYNSTDTLVDGITAHSNGEYGVLAYECDRLTLENSNIDSNGMSVAGEDYAGVYLEESSGCSFLNNIITGNSRLGIKLWYTCPDTLIANSEITNNGDPTEAGSGTGIYISGSDAENITVHSNIIANTHAELQGTGIKNWAKNSTIYNNYFNNTGSSDVFSAAPGTVWNVTPTHGTNIIGGPWIAGNYWEDYEGVDSDGDGLGDTLVPYTADGEIQEAGDYHPLLDTFVPDSIPPVLYIINPVEGEEYIPQQVSLKTFSPDPDAAFWWYSLNGAENVSFDSDAILRDLPLGENTLTVYLNDTSGNMNFSVVNFTVAEDQTAPEIHIVSPENGFEYNTSRDVPLKVWSPDADVFNWWCSLDGGSNTSLTPNATLAGLANGIHTLIVYADDVVGNTNSSQVTFTVNVNEEENPPSGGGGGSGTGGAVIISPGEESSEEEEEEEEELLGDYLIILTPEEGRTVSRDGELRYACTVPLARAYYSLDEGTEKEVEPLAPVPVDRLKLGEHIFRVTGVDYEGDRYHASAKFEVIPLALGEKPDVGTPEYPDEAVYAFNGRAANYTLTFEASDLEDGEVGVYINRYLSGSSAGANGVSNENEIGNPVPLLSLHESGGLLGTQNSSGGTWQAYSYTIPANRIVPEAENFLSFINRNNPGTASGSDSWHVRNIALVPEMPLSYPRIRVFTPDRALSPEDEMMVWVDISGIGEAGGSSNGSDGSYSGSGADDYEASVYVVGPDGTVFSFPDGETTPEPLAQSYLEENHYGRIPGAMTFDESFLPGTYTLVGILNSLESGKTVSISSEGVYYSDQPSVKLFLNRNSLYPGMPLTIEAAFTEGKAPESVSVLTRLERPEGADLFLPEKTGAFSMLHYAPLEDGYMTLYNEPVNGNWENGTYAVKCSLFNESGYELASDVLSFEVGTAESELSIRFDMPEDTLFPVVKSNIRLIDAASFEVLAEKSTTGPQPSVDLQAPPGTYWIAGEIYTENGDAYRIPVSESNRVELGCGEKRTKSVSVSRISFFDFVNMLNEEVEA